MPNADLKITITGEDKAGPALKSVETQSGKTEAGLGSLNTGALAAAAALLAVGVKSVLAFEDLGVTVGKFSAATGMSNDASSRLIAVGKELGIGSDQLQSAIDKMAKGMGVSGEGLKKFGVEAVKGKDGMFDMNATFAAAVGHINSIQDPLVRTATMAGIFGKGFAGSAELMTKSTADIVTAMASVDSAQVFGDKKVEDARKLRDGFAQIKAAGEDLVLTVSKAMIPVITSLTPVFKGAIDILASANTATHGYMGMVMAFGAAGLGAVKIFDQFTREGGPLSKLKGFMLEAAPATEANTVATEGATVAAEEEGVAFTTAGKAIAAASIVLLAITAALMIWNRASEQSKHANEVAAQGFKDVSTAADASVIKTYEVALVMAGLGGKSLTAANKELAASNIEGAKRVLEIGLATGANARQMDILSKAIADQEVINSRAAQTKAEADKKVADSTAAAATQTQMYQDRVQGLTGAQDDNSAASERYRGFIIGLTAANLAAKTATELLATETRNYAQRDLGMATQALKDAAAATQKLDDEYNALVGNLNAADAWVKASAAIDTYTWKMKDGVSTTAEQEQAARDAARAIADYVRSMADIPPEVKSRIYADLSANNLAGAEAELKNLTRDRNIQIVVDAVTTANYQQIVKSGTQYSVTPRATGGPVAKGVPYAVGEQGTEMFVPDEAGTIVPHGATRGPSAGAGDTYIDRSTTNHNYPPSVSVEALQKANRMALRRGIR